MTVLARGMLARKGGANRLAVASAGAALWLAIVGPGALAQDEPARTPRPAEGIEAVETGAWRDGSTAALIDTVTPPPPPAVLTRCPESVPCTPDSDLSQIAWLVAGLTTAGMLLTSWWAVVQQRRAGLIREELSRIRLHRTSQIRTGRSLGEVKMPPPGLGRTPAPAPPAEPTGGHDVAPVAAVTGVPGATASEPAATTSEPGDDKPGGHRR